MVNYRPKFGDLVQLEILGTGVYGLVTDTEGHPIVRCGNGLEVQIPASELDPVPMHFNSREPTNFAESTRRNLRIDDVHSFGIFGEIVDEREYQDEQWGGPDIDDTRSDEDWVAYIDEYAKGLSARAARHKFRVRMLKVAALAVAAIQAHDRLAADPPTGVPQR